MRKMSEDISQAKEFRGLDDGRYLFRDQLWSRTVILDAENAVKVFEAREKVLRQSVWFGGAGGALGGLLVVLYRFDLGYLIPFVIVLGMIPLLLYAHFARERAYHYIVRAAPTAPEALPFAWGSLGTQAASRLSPAIVKFGLVLSPLFAAFTALGIWAALSASPINWLMLGLGTLLFLFAVALTVFYWKAWLIQKHSPSA